MKLKIESKVYSFIWGTKCYTEVIKSLKEYDDNLKDSTVDMVLVYAQSDPLVLTRLIYTGLDLWCDKNNEDNPFEDFEDFLYKYDTLAEPEFYSAIVTDILESTYMGSPVVEYLEKKFNIAVTDFTEQKKAKKKYLDTLEKSLSNLQAGGIDSEKSTIVPLRNTKRKNTVKS